MFGFVICNKEALTEDELERYQSLYCGLCKTLGNRFGQLSRISLNYDMTFLILLLSALYEPEETKEECRCGIHPINKKHVVTTQYTEYAADMTIALTYFKCLDDWNDEKKRIPYTYSKILKKHFLVVQSTYPRQCRTIEESLKELTEIENNNPSLSDKAINCSGKMLSEVFVYHEDEWSAGLRKFGYELGRFIYLMDAAIDYEKDKKKDNYNPLFYMQMKPEEIGDISKILIGNATVQFEKLPIVQDISIIRNILYSGVWQQYNARVLRKESKDDSRSL